MRASDQAPVVHSAPAGGGKGRVSVCIPSHNSARHIGETIHSVLVSTYTDFEIIVNDNASTDNTREIVEGFTDDRVRFYQNARNLGPVRNWNRAVKRASGEFVGLLFSDDLYGPFWLTWAVRVLENHPHVGWVTTAYTRVDEEGNRLGSASYFPETREYSLSETFEYAVKLNGFGPGFVVRREVLERAGYYDEQAGFSADNELFLRLASRYPLCYSSYPHVTYRVRPGSLSHRWSPVQQAIEGFYGLNGIFGDPALPEDMRRLKESAYAYFYNKVLANRRACLARNDFEAAQRLMQVLRANGYETAPASRCEV